MPKIELDKIDDLPEPVRPLFTPKPDGKGFVYDPEAIPETAGLRATAQRLLGERAQLAQQVGEFTAIGKSAAELKAEREELAALRANQGKGWEAERTTLVERHRRELEEKDKAYTSLSGSWAAAQLSAATQAAVAPIAVEGSTDTLAAMLRRGVAKDGTDFRQVDWRQDKATGQWGVVVLDPAGNPRTKGSVGEPFTLEDLVTELRTTNKGAQYLIKATDGSGSGGRPGGGSGDALGAVARQSDLKTSAEKARFINVRGLEAWLALPP